MHHPLMFHKELIPNKANTCVISKLGIRGHSQYPLSYPFPSGTCSYRFYLRDAPILGQGFVISLLHSYKCFSNGSLLVASPLVPHLLAKVILWTTTLMTETLCSGYYLYGTCKLCAYIYSNFCSRVKETTVRKFSIASVAICNRAPNHPGAQRQTRALSLNSIKEIENM